MYWQRFYLFNRLIPWFTEQLTLKSYRPRTITMYHSELTLFRFWLEELSAPVDLDVMPKELLQNYTLELYQRNLAPKTIHRKLAALRCFFKICYQENKLYRNLAEEIHLPRLGRRIPTNILSEEDTEKLFAILEEQTGFPRVNTFTQAVAVRDRLTLELLYSCGLRSSELRNLQLDSVNYARRVLTVRDGKGGKDRIVPVGAVALRLTELYLSQARPFLTTDESPLALFLSRRGTVLTANTLRNVLVRTLKQAGIEQRIRIHDLRHTCATHMLNNGADIRYVQELLGHKSLSSTQIYTHVAITKLQESHAACHPRERWRE